MPVHRQRAAGRQLVRVGRAHDQRIAAAHFLMQQPHGILLVVVGAEAVGTDQLGEVVRLVRVRGADAAHFVEDDGDAGLCGLPGGFGPGQAPADDMNG